MFSISIYDSSSLFSSRFLDFFPDQPLVRRLRGEYRPFAAGWSQRRLGQALPSTRGWRKQTWIESVLG